MRTLEEFGDLHGKPQIYELARPLNIVGSLKDLNLDTELYQTYAKAKNYLDTIEFEDDIPPNQKAQVINTVTAILKEIVRLQTDLYNAEMVKKLEQAMITALKTVPKEAQETFFNELARLSQ